MPEEMEKKMEVKPAASTTSSSGRVVTEEGSAGIIEGAMAEFGTLVISQSRNSRILSESKQTLCNNWNIIIFFYSGFLRMF